MVMSVLQQLQVYAITVPGPEMASSHYDRLGIEPNATEDDIEAAVDAAIREIAGRKRRSPKDQLEIERLTSVRELLLDRESREKYDRALARGELQPDSERDDEGSRFVHYSVYNGAQVAGFGRGHLVSVRSVTGPDLLTIEFADGPREIIANHPGLQPVD
jgi:curved DNA-binding protein CbpA